ncbi:hypothetical protein F5887DRAFT_1080472 [Amanita rubescens]|nr:hypothetical protein F5887DRAFT_1080472 [Amanita rubescens]
MAIGFRKCWRSQWQSACCGCCRDVEEGLVEVQIADGVSADVVVGGRKCWRGGALLPAIAVIPVIRINSTDPYDFFKGPKWIEGNPDNLPESLQHRSAVSTPKAAVKTTPKGKTFGVTQESESGTESSDENPDQQFESSSDLSESEDKTVPDLLSPIDFNPFEIEQEKPNSPGLQYIEVDPKPDPSPGPPVPPKPPTPPPEPPIATMTTPAIQPIPSLLGEIPTFTGKRSQAQDFIDRMELFLDLNPGCINTDRLKIGLTLSMITDKAENWRRNQNNNLNDAAKTEITWNDWTGFKTRFLNNWQEIDSPGNAYTELVQLQKRKTRKENESHPKIRWFIQRMSRALDRLHNTRLNHSMATADCVKQRGRIQEPSRFRAKVRRWAPSCPRKD